MTNYPDCPYCENALYCRNCTARIDKLAYECPNCHHWLVCTDCDSRIDPNHARCATSECTACNKTGIMYRRNPQTDQMEKVHCGYCTSKLDPVDCPQCGANIIPELLRENGCAFCTIEDQLSLPIFAISQEQINAAINLANAIQDELIRQIPENTGFSFYPTVYETWELYAKKDFSVFLKFAYK